MSRPRGDLGARLIRASGRIDRAFRLLDRIRTELVLAFASDEVLDRYNNLMYSHSLDYDPVSADFLDFLYPWEKETFERFLPAPPARVLVGAAGSGREAFALAEKGYEVVAFEPAGGLARSMSSRIRPSSGVRVFRAAYEDLPSLAAVEPGHPVSDLGELGPFDGSLLGLGSISHVRTMNGRVQALRTIGAATRGPIVVSFLTRRMVPSSARPRAADRLRRSLRTRRGRDLADGFSLDAGFYHLIDETELRDIAERARLRVVHYDDDVRRVYPHAVLQARD